MYLVTFDGQYNSDYGSEIYVLGIYDDKIKTSRAINEVMLKYPNDLGLNAFTITKLDLNHSLNVVKESGYMHSFESDEYLGGYSE
jgi:hypothetical protein